MTNLIYGVCVEGGEVDTFTDAQTALRTAEGLKLAEPESLVTVVLWTDDPAVSY